MPGPCRFPYCETYLITAWCAQQDVLYQGPVSRTVLARRSQLSAVGNSNTPEQGKLLLYRDYGYHVSTPGRHFDPRTLSAKRKGLQGSA